MEVKDRDLAVKVQPAPLGEETVLLMPNVLEVEGLNFIICFQLRSDLRCGSKNCRHAFSGALSDSNCCYPYCPANAYGRIDTWQAILR